MSLPNDLITTLQTGPGFVFEMHAYKLTTGPAYTENVV